MPFLRVLPLALALVVMSSSLHAQQQRQTGFRISLTVVDSCDIRLPPVPAQGDDGPESCRLSIPFPLRAGAAYPLRPDRDDAAVSAVAHHPLSVDHAPTATAGAEPALQVARSPPELDPRQATALNLSNTSDRTLHAQVRLLLWNPQDGEDRRFPARELAVSPPLVEIAPHRRQSVRVVWLTDTPPARETAYRLIVDQLPGDDADGPQSMFRHSTPVFVVPVEGDGPEWVLAW